MAEVYAKDMPQGFSNRIEKVAIVGAGGQFGKHIAKALLKNGKHVVTAIARPSSTNKVPEGVQLVHFDYNSDDDKVLVQALQGQEALIITLSVTAPPDTIIKLVRAAAKAGVPYVLPNWWGHDPANDSLCTDSLLAPNRDRATSEIKSLGISSYLLLACNFWFEFSLGGGPDRYGFDFTKRSFIIFDDGKVPINTTTWTQSAQAIARLLSLKELPENETDHSPTLSQFKNNSVYVSSFRVTQLDMFESVKRVTGTNDSDWTITHESAEQRWKDGMADLKQGNHKAFTKMLYARMFFPNGDADYETSRGLDNDKLGLPVEDLDEWTAIGTRMGLNGEVAH